MIKTDKESGNSVNVIGVKLYKNGFIDAINTVVESAETEKLALNNCISATGAHGMVYSKQNKEFKKIIDDFFINLPDGMPGVWVGRVKGASDMTRCYGPDFFAAVMKESADKNIKHYLCGGMEGVADKLKLACEEKFGNNNVVGTFCPPFKKVDEYNYISIANEINATGADIVWVGISTPKQEQFAWRLSKFTKAQFLITVGAAFDFHIGNVKQAPNWIQRSGLEWFYRLLMEPKRLWKRYIEIVPLFAVYSFVDLVRYFKNSKTKK